jgi:putative ABC transport system permease protein
MSWLNRIFKRRALYDELTAELRQHIEEKTEQLMRSEGLSRGDAEQSARRVFGNPTLVEERSREVWQWPSLESIWDDIRYTMRQMRNAPVFACIVISTLALGIGANTAVFSLVDTVLLRPLPYAHPERLVVVWQTDAAHRGTGAWFNAYREFDEWRHRSRSFEQLAALSWATSGHTILAHGKRIDLLAIPASVNFFSMLGVSPRIGRTFAASDLMSACTLVLSHPFWQGKLGADSSIIGQTLVMNGSPCAVVGVMPRSFSFYPLQTDAWLLITPASEYGKRPWDTMTGVFGRLKPGTSRAAAQAELDAIEKRILPESPDMQAMGVAMPDVLDLQSNFTWLTGRNLRTALWALLGAVALVLLMACVNVANLQLGRSLERSREMAVRAALGSGRRRLVRQMLTESFLLSLCGTIAGIGLALALLKWFQAAHPVELPPGNPVTLNLRVLSFTSILGIASAIFFGLLPALRGSRVDLNAVLKCGERGTADTRSSHRASTVLVAAQVALSLMLLTGAGLLIESLWRFMQTPVGYRTDDLLTTWINLSGDRYKSAEARAAFYNALAPKIAALPGVESITGASHYYPNNSSMLSIEGKPDSKRNSTPSVASQTVSSGFFQTMQIPLLQGRAFDTRDRIGTPPVAIVNQALVEKYFPHENPIGRAIKLGRAEDASAPWLTIVGIVGNVRTTTVFQEMGYVINPAVYRSLAQDAPSSLLLTIATHGNPLQISEGAQHQLQSIDPELLLSYPETMQHVLAADFSQPRFRAVLFGSFASLALVLAALGIYGLLSQAVQQRRRDIGIRMALGATRSLVLRSVLQEALRTVSIGLLLGITGAALATRTLASMLYGVQPENAAIFSLAAAILLLTALAASLLPARRAASIDPMQTLRSE